MEKTSQNKQALDVLKHIFHDQPDLLSIVTLGDIESQELRSQYQQVGGLFTSHVNIYAVGRTSAGKTSIGNMLFGQLVMKSSGHTNCTDYIGLFRMKSNLWYFDTAGAGSNEKYENITRVALRLKQIERPHPLEEFNVPVISEFRLEDFTNAQKVGEHVENVVLDAFTPEEWETQYNKDFAPDIILYTVAPNMLFTRDDRLYFYDMLKAYGEKVVIALNIWYVDGVKVTTQQNIEDAKKEITRIYQALYPDGSLQPHFVEINALTGTGINELTEQICRMLPQEKLGNVQKVLQGDLKKVARRERDRRFLSTLNRISARLALYPVNQKAGHEDLIHVAAQGIALYGTTTFKGVDDIIEINNALEDIATRIEQIKDERSEAITKTHVSTKDKVIYEHHPIIENIEKIRNEKQQITDTVVERVPKSFMAQLDARFDGAVKHVQAFFRGADKGEHDRIRTETANNTTREETRTVVKEVEVPIKKIEQKVVGYEKRVVDTIQVVDKVVEVEVGRKALSGGLPVIEFLVGLGLGIRSFCLNNPPEETLQDIIAKQQQQVQLALGPAKNRLEQLVQNGDADENGIVTLLDTRIAVSS